MNLGERIRFARTKVLKMTQAEFAQNVGVSQAALSEIENGKRNAPVSVVEKLATHAASGCDIDIVWILTGVENKKADSREEALLCIFRNLDERGKGAVEQVARYESVQGSDKNVV